MPLFWTGFRLISMGMAKNGVLKQLGLFSFFAHAHEPFLLTNLFLFFFLALFFPFAFLFYFHFFAAHFIVFLLHGIVAG